MNNYFASTTETAQNLLKYSHIHFLDLWPETTINYSNI